jgi:type IV pilus assembly protein PilA
MFNMVIKKLKDQRGLTLIELLAVIVILGIIAAIAIPSIGNVIENSKKSAIRADALQIISAAKLYVAENGEKTPLTSTELDDLVKVSTFTTYSVSVVSGEYKFTGDGKKDTTEVKLYDVTVDDIDNAAKDAETIGTKP